MSEAHDLRCPGCGSPVFAVGGVWECEYCHRKVFIERFDETKGASAGELNKLAAAYSELLTNDDENSLIHTSLGMVYFRLGLFDKALKELERTLEKDIFNSEVYFLAACALLGGKKPFLQQRATIDKIEKYANAAIEIEPRAIYYYFSAYIRYDYFARKSFTVTPDYKNYLDTAKEFGFKSGEADELFALMGLEIPEELKDGRKRGLFSKVKNFFTKKNGERR